MAAVRGGKVHPICVPPDLVWLHVAACTVEAVWLPCLSDGVVEIARGGDGRAAMTGRGEDIKVE
jgi:hypothetical protein